MPIRSCSFHSCLLSIFFLAWFGGCATQSGPPNERPKSDLSDVEINNFNQFEGKLYAATSQGLHRKEKFDTSWVSLGLTQKEVIDVVFLPGQKLLAAVRISDFSSGIPSLFLSADDGRNWQPYMNNYGGDTDVTWVDALTAISKPSDTLFAGGGLLLARSLNGGKSWQLLGERWDLWGGQLNFLITDPYYGEHLWFGGHDAFSWPFLVRSTDNGDSGQGFKIAEKGVEATVWDVWVSPNNVDNILIATGGVQLSTDGGETWNSVFNQAKIFTLTHSAQNSEVVYASGRNVAGTLFFAVSRDFGDTWEMIEVKTQNDQIIVNDMVSVIEDGNEILYFGTNKGVYSYRMD